jgi:hypothetical protein
MIVAAGITQRLAERTGVESLRTLLFTNDRLNEHAVTTAKLPVVLRHAAWWDGTAGGALPHEDFLLPECRVIRLVAHTPSGKPVIFGLTAGHNDGHHSHTDIASFILHIDGESLICDPGRGLYNKPYFRAERYQNIFNNSYTHNVPRFAAPGEPISTGLQAPGPEFSGRQQFYGTFIEDSVRNGPRDGLKFITVDFHTAYDLPGLVSARRIMTLDPANGAATLRDTFIFSAIDAPGGLPIEEAFLTWMPVELEGATAYIRGARTTLELRVESPADAIFTAETLDSQAAANRRSGTLTRLSVALPAGTVAFALTLRPVE